MPYGLSDEYPVYAEAIRAAYGRVVTPPRTGKPGRPRKPSRVLPAEVTYATVHEEKENGRVVRVSESAGEHELGRASQRDGSGSVQPQGAEELRVLEVVDDARGGSATSATTSAGVCERSG